MSSGNGGAAQRAVDASGYAGTYNAGGLGAQLSGNVTLSIPSGYAMPYFVGGNGIDGEVPANFDVDNSPDDYSCLSRGSAVTAPVESALGLWKNLVC